MRIIGISTDAPTSRNRNELSGAAAAAIVRLAIRQPCAAKMGFMSRILNARLFTAFYSSVHLAIEVDIQQVGNIGNSADLPWALDPRDVDFWTGLSNTLNSW